MKVLKREVLGEEDKQAKESIENKWDYQELKNVIYACLLYTSPSPRDRG